MGPRILGKGGHLKFVLECVVKLIKFVPLLSCFIKTVSLMTYVEQAAYRLQSLSPFDLDDVVHRMQADDDIFNKYYK